MSKSREEIVALVRDTLVRAGSTFRPDKKAAYERAAETESKEKARWVLNTIIANADAAEAACSPLCDDTGIPHIVLEVGSGSAVTGEMLDAIDEGVAEGLRKLPGRPMGIMGGDRERIERRAGSRQCGSQTGSDTAQALRGQHDAAAYSDVRRRPGHSRQNIPGVSPPRCTGRDRRDR